MTRLEPPPGITDTWDLMILTVCCSILQRVHGRPRSIALFTDEEYETWRAAVRIHRDAWLRHMHGTTTTAADAYDRAEIQGRAAGWWVQDTLPFTPTVPLISGPEAAEVLLRLDPDGAHTWALELLRAVRKVRQQTA